MNIVIIGQGAIGLLCYAHLKKSTEDYVTLLTSTRSKLTEFTFTNAKGKSSKLDIQRASQQTLAQADLVIYCVKSYQLSQAVLAHIDHLNKNAVIVLAHNGMGTLVELPKPIFNHHILMMLLTHGSKKITHQHIEHTGLGSIDIGEIHKTLSSEVKEKLLAVFEHNFAPVQWQEQIKTKQWLKLAINCVINPITALYDINNGAVNDEKFDKSIDKILAEIVAVAKTDKVQLTIEELKQTVLNVANATAKNCSSMRVDVLSKQMTEIDYINGYVHRLGLESNIETPENTRLWQAVKALNDKH